MKRFEELFAELTDKVARQDPDSGTVEAVNEGRHAIGKKVLEEAGEVWMAAEHEGPDRTFLPMAWRPSLTASTVPESGSWRATLSVSSANNSSKRFMENSEQ